MAVRVDSTSARPFIRISDYNNNNPNIPAIYEGNGEKGIYNYLYSNMIPVAKNTEITILAIAEVDQGSGIHTSDALVGVYQYYN